MENLDTIKKKIEEIQTKSLVAQDMRAFVQLVLTLANSNKEELLSLSKEQIQTIQEAVDYVNSELKGNRLILEEAKDKISQETNDLKNEFAIKISAVEALIEEIKSIEIRDGIDGKDGKDGKDGSPDTGEQIIEKINLSKEKIDRERVKDLDGFATQANLDRAISILDQRTQFLINKQSTSSSGSGTVTSVSATDGNGFDFTITNPTTTPNISLTTTLTSTRVPYITTGGALTEDTAFRWNTTAQSGSGMAGQLLLGHTTPSGGARIYANKSVTGATVGSTTGVIGAEDISSTYDTTAGNMSTSAGYFAARGSRSAGSNYLLNIGVYASAQNGTYNTALLADGNIGINGGTTTAQLHIFLAQTGAGTAPIKLTGGASVMGTPEVGAIEMSSAAYVDGSHLYWTDSAGTRWQLDQQSASLTDGSGTTFNTDHVDWRGTLTQSASI
jgi:hypothetical protein